LREKADHIFLLKGGRSTKEKDQIRMQMRAVPDQESMILVAIGQYIGEGFNYPRLDTMLLTMPISWEGNVEQYAGRLHRDYEGKQEVVIYDYVDSHIRVLEKMYHKRLRTYKKIGYELFGNPVDEKQTTEAIFDSNSYMASYEKDLQEAGKEILVSSPGLNRTKTDAFIHIICRRQEDGIRVTIITLDPQVYPAGREETTRKLIEKLKAAGIEVETRKALHEHFAIMDREVVWYGSMNFLSSAKEDDNLMRVKNKEIAQELMEITFDRVYGNKEEQQVQGEIL
jgi:hypothetical protein